MLQAFIQQAYMHTGHYLEKCLLKKIYVHTTHKKCNTTSGYTAVLNISLSAYHLRRRFDTSTRCHALSCHYTV